MLFFGLFFDGSAFGLQFLQICFSYGNSKLNKHSQRIRFCHLRVFSINGQPKFGCPFGLELVINVRSLGP